MTRAARYARLALILEALLVGLAAWLGSNQIAARRERQVLRAEIRSNRDLLLEVRRAADEAVLRLRSRSRHHAQPSEPADPR